MKSRKVIVLAGFGVAAVAVLATAVIMFRALASAADTRRDRDSVKTKLESFYGYNPFPSEENIASERENLEVVQDWYENLFAGLMEGNVPSSKSRSSDFSYRRERLVRELIQAAPTGEGGERVVPGDFAFAFDRYSTGVQAEDKNVPRLMQQLYIIEQLVKEIYAAGVLRIDSISREEFESGSEQASDPYGGGGRRGGRRGGYVEEEQEEAVASSIIEGPVPMDCQRFNFELTLREKPLVDLLNGIARLPIFAVVSKLSFIKEGTDYVLAPTGKEESAPSGFGDRKAVTGVATNLPPLSRTARLVSGRDREALLKASMEISVYSFIAKEKD